MSKSKSNICDVAIFSKINQKLGSIKDTLTVLLKQGLTPKRMAAAFTVGFLSGTIPVYGTHTAVGVSIGLFFGLNQILINIGVWVSLPVYVALLYPSLRLGEVIVRAPALDWQSFTNNLATMTDSLNQFQKVLLEYGISFLHLCLGWLILTVIMAPPLYFLSYFIAKNIKLATKSGPGPEGPHEVKT